MFAATCDNASEIQINANPDGKLDGPLRISVVSGDGTFSQDPAEPNSFWAKSGTAVIDEADPTGAAGQTVYAVAGDARKGPEEVLLEDTVVLTVTAVPEPEATTLGFSSGATRPKTA